MKISRQPLLFETEVRKDDSGAVSLVPGKVIVECSVERARALLGGVSSQTVLRLWRSGLINGYQPSLGRVKKRNDGRRTNAKVILCAESILRYREAMQAKARK